MGTSDIKMSLKMREKGWLSIGKLLLNHNQYCVLHKICLKYLFLLSCKYESFFNLENLLFFSDKYKKQFCLEKNFFSGKYKKYFYLKQWLLLDKYTILKSYLKLAVFEFPLKQICNFEQVLNNCLNSHLNQLGSTFLEYFLFCFYFI